MNVPFYVIKNQVLFGQSYELRYFRAEDEAKSDCDGIPGAYVMETSPGLIWRATVPEHQ